MNLASLVRELKAKEITLIAHYYTPSETQDLAVLSGGMVGDSFEMAIFGQKAPNKRLLVAGARFMGETAKIINPEKQVFLLDPQASCSLDIGCPVEEFRAFKQQHLGRTVVVYANTSALIKAEADWVVTSSIAKEVIQALKQEGKKILWAPDANLGDYLRRQTQADLVSWTSKCYLHDRFRVDKVKQLKQKYPESKFLAHPECSPKVLALADFIGSTAQMLCFVEQDPTEVFLVATDTQLFHCFPKEKQFINVFNGSTHEDSCTCLWMKMNSLSKLSRFEENEVILPRFIIEKAQQGLFRMINFKKNK